MRRYFVLLFAACGCGGDSSRPVADGARKQPAAETPRKDPAAGVAGNQPTAAPNWTPVDLKPNWGSFIDPDNDCKQTWKDGTLTIEVPGKSHELQWNGQRNAPRFVAERNGDFAMSVRVSGKLSPKEPTGKFAPYQGAGIFVMESDARFIRIERAKLAPPKMKPVAYLNFEEHGASGSKPVQQLQLSNDESIYLKIERRQNKVMAYMGRNGTSWNPLGEVSFSPNASLKFGVAAVNSSKEAFTVEFSDFRLFEAKK